MIRKPPLILAPRQAHSASLAVAVLSGEFGGVVCFLLLNWIHISLCWALAAGLGYLVPFIVCKYFYPSAHDWYGFGSYLHRVYDLIGIVASLVTFGSLVFLTC